MIRKKIISTGVILSIFVLSRLYSTPNVNVDSHEDPLKRKLIEFAERKLDERKNSNEDAEEAYLMPISFAEESLPLGNQSVRQKLDKYLSRYSFKKYQSYRLHKKAETHLPKIADILASYGIPEDFKYIPLVESGLDAKITSHKGAGGFWQFMPATARLYGLKVNSAVDERKDLIKSTHAAARYIKSLYQEFGDWTLVAAAYNVGGGSLKSSMRRQNKDSYYSLKLNTETASYVYKLVSMKEVIENPTKYGYKNI